MPRFRDRTPLAWLIDAETHTGEIYRPNKPMEIAQADSIPGEGPVEGCVLHLARVWHPVKRWYTPPAIRYIEDVRTDRTGPGLKE